MWSVLPTDRMRPARVVVVAAILAIAVGSHRASAQGGVLLQGIADGEFWATSATSNLLTRNAGKPATLGRVQLWGAFEPVSGLVLYAQGEFDGGSAYQDVNKYETQSDQFGVRYAASRTFVVDVGKLTPLIGTFASRRFSTRNPLIGLPDGYSLEYPLGAEVSGETSHFDYRAALVSLPSDHANYVPTATARLRPAIGAGFTPMVGFRIGASATVGSYLNSSLASTQLAGKSWSDYHQRVLAFDLAYAHGYLETHAEYAWGNYDVPGRASSIGGPTYYGEAKYTLTPRFFVAARVERNDYPFIRSFGGPTWVAKLTDFADGEVGVGYRLTASALLKASFRGDRWWIAPGSAGFLGQGGHAIAVQFSQSFDVMNWFEGEK